MRPVGPALRAEGPAARLAQELSLGVGEQVSAEVLSDLGSGMHEIRLAGRVLKVQSSQPLTVGEALLLAVRQSSGRLLLEILGQRQVGTPEAALSERLATLGAPRDAAYRDAMSALLERGLPADRRTLDLLVSVGEAFPDSPGLARRAAAFLVSQALEPTREAVETLLAAARGGSLQKALALPEVRALLEGEALTFPGPTRLAQALARVEEAAVRLLSSSPRLAELDGQPPSEEKSRAERQAMEALPGLKPLREAATALRSALHEEAGRLQLGADGARYAEGVFQPSGKESLPVRLRVLRREQGGGGEARKGPQRVGVALDLSALGAVGADLVSEAGRLAVTLKAERPEAGELLSAHRGELAASLKGLGFEAAVSVAPAGRGDLDAVSRGPLGLASVPLPLVDLKA